MGSAYEADHRPVLDEIARQGREPEAVVQRLAAFAIEVPSWGFADTGTRFGKFHQPAAARTIEEKVADAVTVHQYSGITPALAVHVLWDFPDGVNRAVVEQLEAGGLTVGSINANVFQEQCYKYGSFGNADPAVRRRAVAHCVDCVRIAAEVGSAWLTLWFGDGTNYFGQDDIRDRKARFAECLREVYAAMPASMTTLLEYKPFETLLHYITSPRTALTAQERGFCSTQRSKNRPM